MTNPTPPGQVPEALRLAEQYDHGDPAAHGNAWKAAVCTELRRQHARIAELEAQIAAVGAGGVQALSAAPVAFLKSVIALCSHRGYSPANIEVWDKDDKWIADLWRQAESMLTTSPTPPAEQQAQPGAVGQTGCTAGTDEECTRRGCATSCPAQQAVPKAAPGEPSDVEIDDFLDSPACITWVIASNRDRYRLLVRAVLAKWAAPQQEAQEPVAWLNPWRADRVTTDYDAYGEHGIPLYTAPQPAPAPLSDDVSQKTWALLDELEKLRGADRYDEDWDTLNKRDSELRAALAAQGGKA